MKGSKMADSAIRLSASARLVAGALAEVHETTVVALTATAGVSKSMVAKTLTLLESVGAAQRTIRETYDGAREADLWSPGSGLGTLLFTAAAAENGYGHAETLLAADETAASRTPTGDRHDMLKPAAQPSGEVGRTEDDDPSSEIVGADISDEGTGLPDDAKIVTVTETGIRDQPETGGSAPDGHSTAGRLAPGGLAEMVAAALAAHPHIDYSPMMLSHLLGGRSSGAISNVLEKMRATGAAIRTCDKPKRYRHADVPAGA